MSGLTPQNPIFSALPVNSETPSQRLVIESITETILPPVVALDRLSLGGLWTLEGYRREINSPNSDLLALQSLDSPTSSQSETSDVLGIACLWAILDEAHIT
ncbi:MAG: hypothetical protein SFW36_11740, partial [Leptolyngbyaceae cyanobacterium bins.59]|nr:hypothetical protein [Leptolyngbyaceae cyanobacterium bins.59]